MLARRILGFSSLRPLPALAPRQMPSTHRVGVVTGPRDAPQSLQHQGLGISWFLSPCGHLLPVLLETSGVTFSPEVPALLAVSVTDSFLTQPGLGRLG